MQCIHILQGSLNSLETIDYLPRSVNKSGKHNLRDSSRRLTLVVDAASPFRNTTYLLKYVPTPAPEDSARLTVLRLNSVQPDLDPGTICGRTSDGRNCHRAVSDGSVTMTA